MPTQWTCEWSHGRADQVMVERSHLYANLLDRLSGAWQTMQESLDQPEHRTVELREPRKVSHRLSPEQLDELVAEYLGGVSTPELGRRYGIAKSTVLELLYDAGVELRRQGLPEKYVGEAIRRYQQGWTAPQIADHYGVSASNIRAMLHREGTPIGDSRRRRRVTEFDPDLDTSTDSEL